MHSQAHDEVLPHLREQGLDPTPYTAQVDWFFESCSATAPCRRAGPATWWLLERVAPHRGHRALHRVPRRLGAERGRAGPARRRPDHAGPAALARRGGGGAPLGRLRPVPARRRRLPAPGADLGDGLLGAGVPVAARGPLLPGERPDAHRRQGVLQGVPCARPAGHPAQHRGHAEVRPAPPQPLLPPLPGVLHRPGRGLSGRLPRGDGGGAEGPRDAEAAHRRALVAGAAPAHPAGPCAAGSGPPRCGRCPALDPPVSGRPRERALRLLLTAHETIADGVVQLRLEGSGLPRWGAGGPSRPGAAVGAGAAVLPAQ